MDDHAAFLAAIVASPDDDLPRLVYADFLDESGEPGADVRAEFIRIQCELERCTPDDDRRAMLERRERTILRKHASGWLAELTAANVFNGVVSRTPFWQYRRGFLHAATIVAQRFPIVADSLFRLAPTVRAVCLRHGSGAVAGLVRTSQLSKVVELDLSTMCTCGRCPILNELRSLFASPLVANLQRLALTGDRIDPETATALVSSPHLFKLESLDLSNNSLGLGGVRVLVAAKGLDTLRELHLSENSITASGGQVLARAAWLKGLRVLNLSRNQLTDTSGRALLNANWGDDLRRLDLKTNDFGRPMKRLLRAKFGSCVQLSH